MKRTLYILCFGLGIACALGNPGGALAGGNSITHRTVDPQRVSPRTVNVQSVATRSVSVPTVSTPSIGGNTGSGASGAWTFPGGTSMVEGKTVEFPATTTPVRSTGVTVSYGAAGNRPVLPPLYRGTTVLKAHYLTPDPKNAALPFASQVGEVRLPLAQEKGVYWAPYQQSIILK